MTASPEPDANDLIQLLTRDVIEAIAVRRNESPERTLARGKAAIAQITAFAPKDGLQIMLAAQAVLFHTLMVEAVQDARQATNAEAAEKQRRQVVALSRVQLSYLKEYIRCKTPPKAPAQAPAKAAPETPAPTIPARPPAAPSSPLPGLPLPGLPRPAAPDPLSSFSAAAGRPMSPIPANRPASALDRAGLPAK